LSSFVINVSHPLKKLRFTRVWAMLTGDHAHFRELGIDYETDCGAAHSELRIRSHFFEWTRSHRDRSGGNGGRRGERRCVDPIS
jgi:hypothetical protein